MTTASAAAAAPAKINLRLQVLAREDSGYHQIETLFCALELADEISLDTREPGLHLEVHGADLGDVRGNLVYRAASTWFAATGLEPAARIRLTKRVPHGAGLGGGSSDAATTLTLLDQIHGDRLGTANLLRIAATIGADVPFFVARDPLALAWGRGERLLALPPLPVRAVLLAVPDQAMPTALAYAELARRRGHQGGVAPVPARVLAASFADWQCVARAARNDFEAVLFDRIPDLAMARRMLDDAGAEPALLSGSGSSIFGIFESPARAAAAAAALGERFPNWRMLLTRTATAAPAGSVRL
jgi:4-diphosphocytidyl-2-C-methyl-D-erythritol kinase